MEGIPYPVKSGDPAVALVNGKVTRDDVSVPFLANTSMFPLELITSQLGIPMSWNKTTGEVILGKNTIRKA
ncbi:hypothetical protein [Paenibacillus sp. 843]|uniref:hypothetical protein n=1 Tax=Paenibacillus sp. 843 TaxID=3341795 RepID=UPI00372CEEF9